MKVSHIVATSKNGVIGLNGKMPWHLSDDLKRFKRITMGSCIIMGRKTYESIGKPLPGRFNIVVTRQTNLNIEGVHIASDLNAALQKAREVEGIWGNEAFIIGGGEIYKQSLGLVDRVHLTLIDDVIEGDTYYPLEEMMLLNEKDKEDFSGPPAFSFITLEREN